MKKIVFLTTIITLVAIFLIAGAVFFAIFYFSPKTLGKMFDDLGMQKSAVGFYEKAYEKSQSLDDLYDLFLLLDEKKDAKKVITRGNELLESADFIDFANKSDINKNYMTTKEFVYGKIAIATYFNQGIVKSTEVCEKGVLDMTYTKSSPYKILTLAVELSEGEKNTVKTSIEKLQLSPSEREIANEDLSLI